MDYFKRLITRPASIVLLLLISLVAIYLIMLWDTNSVFNYAKSVFMGEISPEDVVNTPLEIYDEVHQREGVVKVDLNIRRAFVIHNFFDGYMWVTYSSIGYDKNGNMMFLATQEFPFLAKWKIHREHGKWVLVEIDEHL